LLHVLAKKLFLTDFAADLFDFKPENNSNLKYSQAFCSNNWSFGRFAAVLPKLVLDDVLVSIWRLISSGSRSAWLADARFFTLRV
jgi:hypothetical protein